MRILTHTLILLTALTSQAQLSVGDSISTDILYDYLEGTNVVIENVSWDCDSASIATFQYTGSNLDSNEGLLMTTGTAIGATGPNNTGAQFGGPDGFGNSDSDLEIATGQNMNDVCILEFDITPDFGILLFDYVFGSEEYPEFVDSFNDGFLFLVSGPGIEGPYSSPFPEGSENFCIIPGTELPVTINNLNNGNDGINGPCMNCEYYIHNGSGSEAPYDSDSTYVQYDGLTTQLLGNVTVTPGETYHVKIVIGDALDTAYDSGIFIQKQGFRSVQTLGIEAALGTDVILFPNPVQDHLSIEGLESGMYELRFTDELGRTVLSESIRIDGQLQMDISDLDPGSYLMIIEYSSGQSGYQRIIKR